MNAEPIRIAAHSLRVLDVTARAFYVIATTGPVSITRGGQETLYVTGTGESFTDPFQRLELRNPGDVEIRVSLWTGNGQFMDGRLSGMPPATFAFSRFVGVMNAGDIIELDDIPAAWGDFGFAPLQRKSIIASFYNSAGTGDMQLRGMQETGTFNDWPNLSIWGAPASTAAESEMRREWDISGPVAIKCTAGQVQGYITEIWYVSEL